MAEVTRQREGEIMRAVFETLCDEPDGLAARDVIAEVERQLRPTEFEQSDYPNRPGVRRFHKMVRFTTISPVKAGWLVKDRGRWILTGEGRHALEAFPDPADLMREALRLYRAWQRAQPPREQNDNEDTIVGTPTMTLEEAQESAWSEIAAYLQAMNPYEFQDLVAGLLEAMGYHVAWVAPPGPDRGVDILAYNDPLGTTGPRIKVQVKRRQDRVNVEAVRAFLSVLGPQDVGLFVSLGGFTPDAGDEARNKEDRRMVLVDIERLVDLWVEHRDELSESDRQRLPLEPVHFLSPRE